MSSNLQKNLFLIFVMNTSIAFANPMKPLTTNMMTLQIELIDKDPSPERPVQVIDVLTGKKAKISLPTNPTGVGHSGQFMIQFLKGDNQKREYEFRDEKGQIYFAFSFSVFGTNKILISRDKERLSKEVFGVESASRISSAPVEVTNVAPVKTEPVSTSGNLVVNPEVLKKMKVDSEIQIKASEQSQMQIELDESQKRAEQLALQEKLSSEQKKKNRLNAENLISEADRKFFEGNFNEAFGLYAKAVELAPEEESYFFRYGVSAYKVGQYDKSLALLSLAEVPIDQSTEKTYYQGLNRIKLKDNDKALKDFLEVVEEKDPKLSPISAYLAGVIQYQSKNFSGARVSMQTVLDTSEDPKLDQSADEMLDLIDRMDQFTNSQKEKYRLSFYLGLNFDENVLNLSTVNSSTDASALRLSYGASALGYFFKTIDSDLAMQFAVSDIYSVDTGLNVTGTLQATDPLEYSLLLPYSLRFDYDKKSYYLSVSPVLKSLAMNVDGDGRAEILKTSGVNFSVTKVLKSNLTAALNLEFLDEQSKLDISSDLDDQSGQKMTYGILTTYLIDLKGEESISFDINKLANNAKGDNYYYEKLSANLNYSTPLKDRWAGVFKVDYSQQNYSKQTSSRLDQILIIGASASKALAKNQSLNLGINYSTSSSNNDSYDYSKWQLSALWTYQLSILQK